MINVFGKWLQREPQKTEGPELYPGGVPRAETFSAEEFKPVEDVSQIPVDVMHRFNRMQEFDFRKPNQMPPALCDFMCRTRYDGSRLFVASLGKLDKRTDHATYFVEEHNGAVLGYAEVAFGVPEHQRDTGDPRVRRPYVLWTETLPEFRNQNRGEVRLKEVNAYTRTKYGSTVSSGPDLPPEALRMWQKLADPALKGGPEVEQVAVTGADTQWYQFINTDKKEL